MQFESFHWLSHHRLWAIIPCSTNMESVRIIFGWRFYFYFSFPYFGGVSNKTIFPLALFGYEMIILLLNPDVLWNMFSFSGRFTYRWFHSCDLKRATAWWRIYEFMIMWWVNLCRREEFNFLRNLQTVSCKLWRFAPRNVYHQVITCFESMKLTVCEMVWTGIRIVPNSGQRAFLARSWKSRPYA